MTVAALTTTLQAAQKVAQKVGKAFGGASDEVESAIRQASARTGVDFTYLMEKAAVESSYRTDLKASTSSATGLYQFIDSTWLATIKKHGAENGLGQYANAIETRSDGRAVVSDPPSGRKFSNCAKTPKSRP